jgi:precorrin-6A/cobalt-precorrin-6A reductase
MAIRALAAATARRLSLTYLTFVRPGIAPENTPEITFAADHEEAARLACAAGKAVLLTTGSRNLRPYAEEAKRTGAPLIVRVLPHPDSLAACRAAGIPAAAVIAGQGPFSVEENIAAIRKFKVAILVTKDSGMAGGVPAKIAAARQENCRLIMVGRLVGSDGLIFPSIEKLLKYLEMNKQMR